MPPHPCRHLLLCVFLITAILVGVDCYFIMELISISPPTNHVGPFFMCLLAISIYGGHAYSNGSISFNSQSIVRFMCHQLHQ